MNCPNCGNNLLPGARFCTKCGSPIETQANTRNNEMQTTPYADAPVAHSINAAGDSAQESSAQPGSQSEKKPFVWNDQYTYIAIAGATALAVLIGLFIKMSKPSGFEENSPVKYEDETSSADYEMEDNWEEEHVAEEEGDEKAGDNSDEEQVLEIREDHNTTSERTNSGFYGSKKKDYGASEYRDERTSEKMSDYILPESDSRYLSKKDLAGLSAYECRLARNELYARHGRLFNDRELQAYFDNKEWYRGTIKPSNFNENILNDYEVYNRDLIVEYEKEKGYSNTAGNH